MRIKRFSQFESISGWELVGTGFGPGSPRQELPVTLSTSDTQTILGKDGNIYTYEDYQQKYNEYKKAQGKEILTDFNQGNLDKVLHYLSLIK